MWEITFQEKLIFLSAGRNILEYFKPRNVPSEAKQEGGNDVNPTWKTGKPKVFKNLIIKM